MFKTQFFLLTQYNYLDPPEIHSWFSLDDLCCHFVCYSFGDYDRRNH